MKQIGWYWPDHSIFNDNIVQDEVMEDEELLDESTEQSSRKISSKVLLSYKEHSNNQWKEHLETNFRIFEFKNSI